MLPTCCLELSPRMNFNRRWCTFSLFFFFFSFPFFPFLALRLPILITLAITVIPRVRNRLNTSQRSSRYSSLSNSEFFPSSSPSFIRLHLVSRILAKETYLIIRSFFFFFFQRFLSIETNYSNYCILVKWKYISRKRIELISRSFCPITMHEDDQLIGSR